ncbi:hypothetical protein [Novosphingobium mangrovi (ex Huang et al. 2023)]|uniref:DUF2285 domain-containing protein n=1 Tax=Novosphingobium mangrovi (ex Huang et al. 2023) TaxID=2976432 RepID=A0ABT2I4X5_9SPHN|nr:hypothetical protein [Novosphingobium mangrovi (ex Huang et al. 2023)]MCT2399860.1 hypothetical protein [Novosphingobium mangrovi (ex Huang et al. 2023)]
MTIRFAAAWGGITPVITQPLCPRAPLGASNDNGRAVSVHTKVLQRARALPEADNDEQLLIDTLRHFARHGLAAAAKARAKAEMASRTGDDEARDYWIAICRQLDRRMAEAVTRDLSVPG